MPDGWKQEWNGVKRTMMRMYIIQILSYLSRQAVNAANLSYFMVFLRLFLYIWYDASSFDDKMYLTANPQTCILFLSMF